MLIGLSSLAGITMGLPFTAAAVLPSGQLPANTYVTFMIMGLMAVARMFSDDTVFHQDFIHACEVVPEFGAWHERLLKTSLPYSEHFPSVCCEAIVSVVYAVDNVNPQVNE